ncbi:MAG: hypothetical protein A2939_04475 [Parcubacteria group bacterium RIFCSPLOWO2_01_FULL_48_18]|nr:MAG: hypothetical protein A2939_04475 [Parcubacteria group bacterium RIFCSPLOWO2_01_FULL_48_18]
MPYYFYKAIDKQGSVQSGVVETGDKDAAADSLLRDGFVILNLEKRGGIGGGRGFGAFFFRKVSAVDKILMTKHLAVVVRAGLSLSEGLDVLIGETKNPLMLAIIKDAKRVLESGRPLSAVFSFYQKYFPPIFVGLIKAGEASGKLEENLDMLGNQVIRDYELMRKVKAALVYPVILLVASMGLIVLLLTFVFPRLVKVFQQAEVELPAITKAFIAVSDLLSRNSSLTVGIFLGILAACYIFYRSRFGKRWFRRLLKRLPVFGALLQKLAIARFSRALGNMTESGASIIEAINVSSSVVDDERYKDELEGVIEELKRGSSLADTFRKREEMFGRLVVSLVAAGEKSGTLKKSLDTVSDFYEEEVDRLLRNLVSLLEPLLLLAMGIIVGSIALSVLLPIHQFVGSLG